MKLRVVYGDALASDREGRRRKARVLLWAGFGVYLPFLLITYLIFFETRVLYLLVMGLLTGLVCIPVVWYAYARGYGRPLSELRRERGRELTWLAAKVGFFYGFELFWMVLGIVEFLFGYHAFRAALISFVAIAVARDGFEIGYYRARQPQSPVHTFPDGRPLTELLRARPMEVLLLGGFLGGIGAALGGLWGPYVPNPLHQTLLVGAVAGLLCTLSYVGVLRQVPTTGPLIRFFLWPALTMAATYFLIFAYLLRIVFSVDLAPHLDQALLTGIVSALMAVYCAFLAFLKQQSFVPPSVIPLTDNPVQVR